MITDAAALGLSALGLVVLVLGIARTGDWRSSLSLTLDLWLAAGLLRLASPADWDRLVMAVAVLFVRQVANRSLAPQPVT